MGNKRKLVIVIAAVFVVLAGGIGAAAMTGVLDGMFAGLFGDSSSTADGASDHKGEPLFYELPEYVVTLNTQERKPTYLKIRVTLELADAKDLPHVEQQIPRISDSFQVFLRELRLDDVKGSAGTFRIRQELLKRAMVAAAPARIDDLLLMDVFIQ